MNVDERFQKAAVLLSKLDEHKITGTIHFTDMAEKMTLKEVYQSIHGGIQMDLSCPSCVFHYLNMLQAWFQREWPKHLKTTVVEVSNVVEEITPVEKIITTEPIKKVKRNKK